VARIAAGAAVLGTAAFTNSALAVAVVACAAGTLLALCWVLASQARTRRLCAVIRELRTTGAPTPTPARPAGRILPPMPRTADTLTRSPHRT
jgi:hypothetical protein